MNRPVDEVALIIRDAEYLQPALTHNVHPLAHLCGPRAGPAVIAGFLRKSRHTVGACVHAMAPSASGGISYAVGCACRNARRQILIVYQHIARTSTTK